MVLNPVCTLDSPEFSFLKSQWDFEMNFIHLFLERWERREKERERNISQLPPVRTPDQGLNPQPRHVP